MYFQQIFEPKLAQNSYLIGCQQTGEAILVDPMRDIDRYVNIAQHASLRIVAVTETHIHADYLSGAREFAEQRGVKVYASNGGEGDWRFKWVSESDYPHQMLNHGDVFHVGNIEFKCLLTPGHTPEHISFLVTDRGGSAQNPMGILSGDFVFVGDVGRPDLLELAAGQVGAMVPAAKTLYQSLKQFKALPNYLQVWPGHGAGSACGKALGSIPISTVGYELQYNPSLLATESETMFVNYILDGQPEPPMYFARMKMDNRDGPAILGSIPEPEPGAEQDLHKLANNKETVLIDTRSWPEFRTGHIPGAIFAPLDKGFNSVVGCYVTPDIPIFLLIEDQDVQEAVLDLIRIGLDDIRGYFTKSTFRQYTENAGELSTIDEIDVRTFQQVLKTEDVHLLDVRRASELNQLGFLDNAQNIAHTRLSPRLSEIPNEKPIMVYCQVGMRSAYAAAFLKKNGYKVTNVAGGFSAWERMGGSTINP